MTMEVPASLAARPLLADQRPFRPADAPSSWSRSCPLLSPSERLQSLSGALRPCRADRGRQRPRSPSLHRQRLRPGQRLLLTDAADSPGNAGKLIGPPASPLGGHSGTLAQAGFTRLAAGVPGKPLRRCSRPGQSRTPRNTRRGNAGEDPAHCCRGRRLRQRHDGTCQRWLGRPRRRPHERERPGVQFPNPEISTALDGEPRPPPPLHYLHSERLEGPLVGRARLRLTSRTRRAKWSMRGKVTGSRPYRQNQRIESVTTELP